MLGPNKTDRRGKGKPDMHVLAYETMLIATGQTDKPKPKPTKKSGWCQPAEAREEKSAG